MTPKKGSNHPNNSRASGVLDSSEKNSTYRENYERCSRLIDGTIVELLNAHKSKQLHNQTEELLGRVTEIYDLLADNIEHIE